MREFFLVALVALSSVCAFGQAPFTRFRADQVGVMTNPAMNYAVYKNLQLDIQALDTNIYLLNKVVLPPTALSNLVIAATANAVFDLMYTFPQMIDPAVVPALIPTGATLQVSNLYVPGNVTCATLTVSGVVAVNGTLNYGTVDSTVATVISPTNYVTTCVTNQWTFHTIADNTFQTPSCVASNRGLYVVTPGIISVSFNSCIFPQDITSNWATWVQVSTASGVVLTNYCSILSTNPIVSFVNFTRPASPGDFIQALASYSPVTNTVRVVGGGAMLVTETFLRDANGNAIGSLPAGGW